LDLNAINNKFLPLSFYTTRLSNEGDEANNTLDEQDDQGQGEQDEGEHAQNDHGQGDQGEHEQRYEEEVVITNLINIHTSIHQSCLSCSNINLNIAQHYYVDMFHSSPMIEDRAEENLIVNLYSFSP
jgi:hypothetical protein